MQDKHSKNTRVYTSIKMSLQVGRFLPGERIDPATLAQDFGASPTPVRLALHRLVGEGLLEDCSREGFHLPRLTEAGLRDLYDWMEQLLVIACNRSSMHNQKPGLPPPPEILSEEEGDLVTSTARLFDAIALVARSACLRETVQRTNNRLTPIRRAKAPLLMQSAEELDHLQMLWEQREFAKLGQAVIDYHARRKILVPRIVEHINQATLLRPGANPNTEAQAATSRN